MKTCGRCGGMYSNLRKCSVCDRKVCGGCSWKSGLNGKLVCTAGRCAKRNARMAKGCTHPESVPCVG